MDREREVSPAIADCGYRAPLAPRLARPSTVYPGPPATARGAPHNGLMPLSQSDVPPSSRAVRAAARAVVAVAVPTPLLRCEPLSRECGCEVWLKPENLQRTGSFKVR